jgi:energy-coupling factor transport system permease protein
MNKTFATQVWVIWLLAIATITLLTRNPFYLLILLLVARVVQASCGIPGRMLTIRFWRLAIIILLLSILFNVLTVHIGETVIVSLPDYLWLIGGDLTFEAAVYGAIGGLILITLLAIFFAFNAVVPTNELVRLTPRALANVGLVTMIALTYVPETIAQLKRIKEAQAVRGHQVKGLRDWQPIVIPLLIGGLERAMGIAETMVARGYGATASVRQSTGPQVIMLITLILALGGWVLTFWTPWLGWGLVLASSVLIMGLVFVLGRKVKHTRYRPQHWDVWDWTAAILAIIPLVLVIAPMPLVDQESIFYTPYPEAMLPPFDLLLGLLLATLAAPAIIVELLDREPTRDTVI